MKAMSHMDQLEGMNDAQLKGWLYRVAVNLCKDALRKQRFETPAEEMTEPAVDSVYELPEAAMLSAEEKGQVRAAIDQLPHIYREAVLLHYFPAAIISRSPSLPAPPKGM